MTKLINRFHSNKLAETLHRLKSQIFVTETYFSNFDSQCLTLMTDLCRQLTAHITWATPEVLLIKNLAANLYFWLQGRFLYNNTANNWGDNITSSDELLRKKPPSWKLILLELEIFLKIKYKHLLIMTLN